LANIHWQQGESEECLKIGWRAARMRPRTPDLQLVAAEAYVLGTLPSVGMQLSERVLAQDPSNPSARFWAVIGAAWSGNLDKVFEHGAEYTRRFGEYFEVYLWMAIAALQRGQDSKALAFAHRALELEGEGGDPRAALFLSVVEQRTLGHSSTLPALRTLRDELAARLAL